MSAAREGPGEVMAGCEGFAFEGGPSGILLLHGFSGNPSSLRPMGEWLADRGYTVACPRLPGHGTTWEDLETTRWTDWAGVAERALLDLSARCERVVTAGLSVGSALCVHLAARRPDAVAGLVLVSPFLRDTRLAFSPLVRLLRRTVRGIGNDIKKPEQDEHPYDRLPVVALGQLWRLLRVAWSELPAVRAPALVFASPDDHVVPAGSVQRMVRRLGSDTKELVALRDSYHVATLDNEAQAIFRRTHEFAEGLAEPASA